MRVDSKVLEKAEIGETATADKPYKARLAAIIEAADLSETKKVRLSALKKEELLREVVDTVGKRGGAGQDLQNGLSVAMLSEGWDAKGARARKPWKNAKAIARRERINGDVLPPALLVGKAEELVLAALPVRLSERYLTEKLGVGLRTLRRSFLDERGATAYVALRRLRLQEAQRRPQAQPDLTPKTVAQQCGFGRRPRFRAISLPKLIMS